jgi:hypothetical protein
MSAIQCEQSVFERSTTSSSGGLHDVALCLSEDHLFQPICGVLPSPNPVGSAWPPPRHRSDTTTVVKTACTCSCAALMCPLLCRARLVCAGAMAKERTSAVVQTPLALLDTARRRWHGWCAINPPSDSPPCRSACVTHGVDTHAHSACSIHAEKKSFTDCLSW